MDRRYGKPNATAAKRHTYTYIEKETDTNNSTMVCMCVHTRTLDRWSMPLFVVGHVAALLCIQETFTFFFKPINVMSNALALVLVTAFF